MQFFAVFFIAFLNIHQKGLSGRPHREKLFSWTIHRSYYLLNTKSLRHESISEFRLKNKSYYPLLSKKSSSFILQHMFVNIICVTAHTQFSGNPSYNLNNIWLWYDQPFVCVGVILEGDLKTITANEIMNYFIWFYGLSW